MADWIKRCVLSIARVPANPVAPEGSAESVQVFRAGKNFYRLQIFMWVLANLPILAMLVGAVAMPLTIEKLPSTGRAIWLSASVLLLLVFLVSLPLTYFSLRLNFELRWYIVTDRSLRIRSGIASVREMTMTFANIQELRVKSGPLQKLLGLADLEVRSAGGGSGGPYGSGQGHIGRFEGLDNAEFIRDLISDRLRRYKDSGLGDHHESTSDKPALLTEAENVLSEARALRATLAETR
jgi:membrane protein YdbS with pleckstrin-like domain